MSEAKILALGKNIGAGLPGSADGYTLDQLLEKLRTYQGVDRGRLQQNLVDFLSEVTPVAEEVGINICAHGDDPPWPLLGLPRILSTDADYAHMLGQVDSRANGVTLCTGSAPAPTTTYPSSPPVLPIASISSTYAMSPATPIPCPAPSSRTNIWRARRTWSR